MGERSPHVLSYLEAASLPVNMRCAIAADIPAILEIERACPTAAHWTQQQYGQALQSGGPADRLCLVIENEAAEASAIAGFVVARRVDREWELENIAVAPAARRTGLGARLLRSLLDDIHRGGGISVFLEVRESNAAAQKLYEKMGFLQTGRRKAYYSNPQEDAVVYEWKPSYSEHP